MTNNIIEIADKTTLQNLKQDLLKENNNPEQILEEYYNNYQQEKRLKEDYTMITCNVTFGYNRNLNTFKKDINNMIPCSVPQNYPKIKKAKGPWKNIYEIAFGISEINNVNVYIKKENNKKKIIKDAV